MTNGRIYARNLEVPSGGGRRHRPGDRACVQRLRRRRSSSACVGRHSTCSPRQLFRRRAGFYDECLKGERPVLPRFHEAVPSLAVRQPQCVRLPGAGGSLGFADPAAGVGYAYVTSQMGTRLNGDPRDVALRDALHAAIAARPSAPRSVA